MKYSLHLAAGASVADAISLRDISQLADELGYDTIFSGDHAILPMKIETAWPYEEWNEGKPHYDVYTDEPWLDMFTVLTFVAAHTKNVRVGTGVLIVPYRDPFDVARRLATIDLLSTGRLVIGCGVGWMEEEFDMLGIPFAKRGKRTDEYINAMKTVWTEKNPRIDTEFVTLDRDINPEPLPLQNPHPPFWIGGESKAAVRRAARLGDGYTCALLTEGQLMPLLDELNRELERQERDKSEVELSYFAEASSLQPDTVKRADGLGIKNLIYIPLSPNAAGLAKELQEFAKRVQDHG
ncbi:TIGR03619 family F420-dependent LLM class oxidoreductase [Myxococcota bacterium]|nr:TIGR03619 family F420-dependent LLM class oxidoreductase [Myxococcota bacterium]|tara:strand:+ start:416 stop:1300 length:885 start_codon:yes stop_codon:yes gene_type:complete